MVLGGGRRLVGALVLALAVASCGSGSSDDASSEPQPSTTESPDASTTQAVEPIPWGQVREAGRVRTGRLVRTVDVVDDESGERRGEALATQVVTFDRDRGLLEGGMTITGDDGVPLEFEFVASDGGMLFSAEGVEEACGAAWVAVDRAFVEQAGLDLDDVGDGDQLGPFTVLEGITPTPTAVESNAVGTTFEVELPASNGIAPSYFAQHAGLEAALDAETTPATVQIEDDLDMHVEQRLPFALIAASGGDDAGPEGEGASIRTRWHLEQAGRPVSIEVPTDVAADPSCAAGI